MEEKVVFYQKIVEEEYLRFLAAINIDPCSISRAKGFVKGVRDCLNSIKEQVDQKLLKILNSIERDLIAFEDVIKGEERKSLEIKERK
jgi:hypothetical protein